MTYKQTSKLKQGQPFHDKITGKKEILESVEFHAYDDPPYAILVAKSGTRYPHGSISLDGRKG